MGKTTEIAWCDSTWSPIRARVKMDAPSIAKEKGYTSLVQIAEKMAGRVGAHCEHVSPGCENCYAETNNHRCLPANGTGLPYDRRSRDLVEAFVDEKVLLQPLKWGELPPAPRRIFVENQSDLFGEWVTDAMRDRVFAMMTLCWWHDFQVLTKRPEQMLEYCASDALLARLLRAVDAISNFLGGRAVFTYPEQIDDGLTGVRLRNAWLGVSDEGNQHQRIDILRQVPAAVRFVSFEPLLFDPGTVDLSGIDWVICGGESGPGARPMHPDWARALRDQCKVTDTAFFFKQWGEWAPWAPDDYREPKGTQAVNLDGSMTWFAGFDGQLTNWLTNWSDSAQAITRVGRKAAGALLDGIEHKAFPAVRE
jgi:protein gp37